MKFTLFTTLVLITSAICAQTPESFRYQAALQTNNGQPMSERDVTLRISILMSNQTRERVYSEFHTTRTDVFGMLNLRIGEGDAVSGDF